MGRQDPYRCILPERDSADIRGTAQRAKPQLLERASCKTTSREERRKIRSELGQSFEGIAVRKPGAGTVTGSLFAGSYSENARFLASELVGTSHVPRLASLQLSQRVLQ